MTDNTLQNNLLEKFRADMHPDDMLKRLRADRPEQDRQRARRVRRLIQWYLEEDETKDRRGSVIGRKTVNRGRAAGLRQLMNDYFAEDPVYDADHFRTRFRMRRELFVSIVEALEQEVREDGEPNYFEQKYDAARKPRHSLYQKAFQQMQLTNMSVWLS